LQVKLCDPRLSALSVPWCKKALYKYSSFPFLFYWDVIRQRICMSRCSADRLSWVAVKSFWPHVNISNCMITEQCTIWTPSVNLCRQTKLGSRQSFCQHITSYDNAAPAVDWREPERQSSANVATPWLHMCLISPPVSPPAPTRGHSDNWLIDWVKVLRPTRRKTGHFGDVLPSQSKKLNLYPNQHWSLTVICNGFS